MSERKVRPQSVLSDDVAHLQSLIPKMWLDDGIGIQKGVAAESEGRRGPMGRPSVTSHEREVFTLVVAIVIRVLSSEFGTQQGV